MLRRLVLLLTVVLCALCGNVAAAADLPIATVDESALPYDFSPSNYDNSSSNYENSESNYDNSSSNYDNGRSGERRLLYKDGSSLKFAGYYVRAGNGVTNFFSSKGKRMFYNPKKGRAVFNGKDGSFCGVLGSVNGQFSLALTEQGVKTLLLSQ